MKLVRYIAFFLSVMVMMGHDAIPHFHEDKHDLTEHSTTLPQSSNDGLTDLQNLLPHFQHPTAERNLVYLGSSEKAHNLQKKVLYNTPFFFVAEYLPAWYANYKKQRFRESIAIPSSFKSNYFSLRAPPFC